MKVLLLEPFYGGSHRDVARGLVRHSSHEIETLSLPARFWKWRMRGAALEFVRRIKDIRNYDLVFATDMMDLADFKALVGPGCPPVLLYFHENQLSYPLAPGEKRDFHLGFTNIVSALAADRVVFNSQFHRDDFFRAARDLIQRMPDVRPLWMLDRIREKAGVLYPGCRIPGQAADVGARDTDPPLVVWNHRWEHDKGPGVFFRVLERLEKKGRAFSLAVLGERYQAVPPAFDRAKQQFESQIRVWGFQPSRRAYLDWLSQGTAVVSTAVQENFGLAVIEAVSRGCFPLLPDRLAYPELVPKALHRDVIYSSESDLENRLDRLLTAPDAVLAQRRALAAQAARFSWPALISEYDAAMAKTAGGSPMTDLGDPGANY